MGILDGKVAVITGASKGIGRVMSQLFAKEGAAVVCAARSGALVDETVALVNNAGDGGPTKPVQEYTEEDWFYTINSCLTSSYMCIRFVVPEMIKAGGGAIVNISSGAGRP